MYKVLKKNFGTLLAFEFFLSLFLYLLARPLFNKLMNFSFKISDVDYLSSENFLTYISSPLVIVFLLIIVLFITLIVLYEIFTINTLYTYSVADKEISLLVLIKAGFKNFKRTIKPGNLYLIIYILLLIPFSGEVYENPIIYNVSVPTYITNYIYASPRLTLYFIVILISMTILAFINIYTFMYMFKNNYTYLKSLYFSVNFIKNHFKVLLSNFIKLIAITVGLVLFGLLTTFLLSKFSDLFFDTSIAVGTTGILIAVNSVINIVLKVILKVLFLYFIARTFYMFNDVPKTKYKSQYHIKYKKTVVTLFTLVLFSLSILTVSSISANVAEPNVIVMAHRGESVKCLENSEDAFRTAMDEGAKYIELDVTLTKDNQVVICHDLNMFRLSGMDLEIRDYDYDYLKTITLSSEYNDNEGQLMLLSDLLLIVNGDVTLNIELKPAENDDILLASLVENLISGYKRHIVSSLEYDCLEEIKLLNENRQTGYIMSLALGDFENLDCVNFYCIEETFINDAVINQIHKMDKKIYVWTVNETENVSKYVLLGVDGIISDYPIEVSESISTELVRFKNINIFDLFEIDKYY